MQTALARDKTSTVRCEGCSVILQHPKGGKGCSSRIWISSWCRVPCTSMPVVSKRYSSYSSRYNFENCYISGCVCYGGTGLELRITCTQFIKPDLGSKIAGQPLMCLVCRSLGAPCRHRRFDKREGYQGPRLRGPLFLGARSDTALLRRPGLFLARFSREQRYSRVCLPSRSYPLSSAAPLASFRTRG